MSFPIAKNIIIETDDAIRETATRRMGPGQVHSNSKFFIQSVTNAPDNPEARFSTTVYIPESIRYKSTDDDPAGSTATATIHLVESLDVSRSFDSSSLIGDAKGMELRIKHVAPKSSIKFRDDMKVGGLVNSGGRGIQFNWRIKEYYGDSLLLESAIPSSSIPIKIHITSDPRKTVVTPDATSEHTPSPSFNIPENSNIASIKVIDRTYSEKNKEW